MSAASSSEITIVDEHAVIPLIASDGWHSLSTHFPDTTLPIVDSIFKEYSHQHAAAIIDSPDNKLGSRECTRTLKRTFRDLFMAYAIIGNEVKVAELLDIGRYMGFDTDVLFKDINEMFTTGFDPYWKVNTIAYFRFCELSGKLSIPHRVALNAEPDEAGSSLKELVSLPPLLMYRTVHHLKRVASQVEFYPKTDSDSGSDSPGRGLDLPSEIYYPLALTFHSPLIDNITVMFNLFFQTEGGQKPNLSARDLRDRIISASNPDTLPFYEPLTWIHSYVHEKFFPYCRPPSPAKSTISEVDLKQTSASTEKKEQKLVQTILDEPTIMLLPPEQRKALLSSHVGHLSQRFAKRGDKLLDACLKLLWEVYKTTSTAKEFYKIVPRLAQQINLLSKAGHVKHEPITDSWKKMLHGDLSPQQMQLMLSQLNIACVQMYRHLDIYEVCKKIEKFIPREKPDSHPALEACSSSASAPVLSSSMKSHSRIKKPRSRSHISSFTKNQINPLKKDGSGSHVLQSSTGSDLSLSESPRSVEEIDLTGAASSSSDLPPLTLNTLCIRIGEMIVAEILNTPDEKLQRKIVCNAIQFAIFALDGPVANYHVARSVFFGFMGSSISRLKSLFSYLPSQSKRDFERLKALFSPEANYHNYRESMASCGRPFIPHIALFQSDFTMATDTKVTDEQIKLVAEKVEEFRKMTQFLKVGVPINAYLTDSLDVLRNFDFEGSLTQPPQKNEFGVLSDWEPEEWEQLPNDEKCYFISVHISPPNKPK